MLAHAAEKANGLVQRIVSNPSIIMTVLIAIAGQVSTSIYFQIINNERQENSIAANNEAIKALRESIFNQNTPLAIRTQKLEDKIESNTKVFYDTLKRFDQVDADNAKRLEAMDQNGSRGFALVVANIARLSTQFDRLADHNLLQDKKIAQIDEIQHNLQRIEDQQKRILDALDGLTKLPRGKSPETKQ